MRKMIAAAFAAATLLLLVPSMAAGAFYGTRDREGEEGVPGRRRHVDHRTPQTCTLPYYVDLQREPTKEPGL